MGRGVQAPGTVVRSIETVWKREDTDGDGRPEPFLTTVDSWIADTNTATTTNPWFPDSDFDGVWDAVEDANRNGQVDVGETDPSRGLAYVPYFDQHDVQEQLDRKEQFHKRMPERPVNGNGKIVFEFYKDPLEDTIRWQAAFCLQKGAGAEFPEVETNSPLPVEILYPSHPVAEAEGLKYVVIRTVGPEIRNFTITLREPNGGAVIHAYSIARSSESPFGDAVTVSSSSKSAKNAEGPPPTETTGGYDEEEGAFLMDSIEMATLLGEVGVAFAPGLGKIAIGPGVVGPGLVLQIGFVIGRPVEFWLKLQEIVRFQNYLSMPQDFMPLSYIYVNHTGTIFGLNPNLFDSTFVLKAIAAVEFQEGWHNIFGLPTHYIPDEATAVVEEEGAKQVSLSRILNGVTGIPISKAYEFYAQASVRAGMGQMPKAVAGIVERLPYSLPQRPDWGNNKGVDFVFSADGYHFAAEAKSSKTQAKLGNLASGPKQGTPAYSIAGDVRHYIWGNRDGLGRRTMVGVFGDPDIDEYYRAVERFADDIKTSNGNKVLQWMQDTGRDPRAYGIDFKLVDLQRMNGNYKNALLSGMGKDGQLFFEYIDEATDLYVARVARYFENKWASIIIHAGKNTPTGANEALEQTKGFMKKMKKYTNSGSEVTFDATKRFLVRTLSRFT